MEDFDVVHYFRYFEIYLHLDSSYLNASDFTFHLCLNGSFFSV